MVVDVTPSHVANTFSPPHSLGAAIDRLRTGTPDKLLNPPLLNEILSAGWQTVTYRQNTELMVEAWHWNARGTWSNPEKQEGYFAGSASPTEEMIHSSWAYPLPHRGFSRGDGNGWSRLTDGDLKSYWKSNPYLTKAFTGEADSLHPQWIIIDLGSKIGMNAIRIAWADPYARRYSIQFWTGELEPFYDGTTKGTWQTFPLGNITEGKGGTVTHKLVSWMIPVRYLRIWMTESSNTCDTHGSAWDTPSTNSTPALSPPTASSTTMSHTSPAGTRRSHGPRPSTHGTPRQVWINRAATRSVLISSSTAA